MNHVSVCLGVIVQLLRIGIAVVLAGVAIHDGMNGQSSNNWPTAEGKVISAKIKKVEVKNGSRDEAEIRYQFKVNGKTFTSDCVQFGGVHFRDQAQIVEKYNSAKPVMVHYKLDNPADSCLEPGFNLYIWAACLGGAVLMICLAVDDVRKSNRDKLSTKAVDLSAAQRLRSLKGLRDIKHGATTVQTADQSSYRKSTPIGGRQLGFFVVVLLFITSVHAIGNMKFAGIDPNVIVFAILFGGGISLALFFSVFPALIAMTARKRHFRLAAAMADFQSRSLSTLSPLSAEAALAFGLQAEIAQAQLQYEKARQLSEKALQTCINWRECKPAPSQLGNDTSRDKIMLKSIEAMENNFAELEAVCHESLGSILFDMGQYDESLTHAKKAVALADDCRAKASSDRSLVALANALSLKGRVENIVGSLDDARKDLERSISLRQGIQNQFDENRALTLAYLSSTYSMLSETKKARTSIEDGFALVQDSRQPAYQIARATLLFHRAEAKIRAGQLTAAEEDLDECLRLRKELLAAGHPEIAVAHLAFANLYDLQSRSTDASRMREIAREMLYACFGNNHPLCEFAKPKTGPVTSKQKVGLGAI